MNARLAAALKNITDEEARVVWEALAQFVENTDDAVDEECDLPGYDLPKVLATARGLVDRLNGAVASLAT